MGNPVFVQDRQTQTGDDHDKPTSKRKKALKVAAIAGIAVGITSVIVISVVVPGLGFAAGGIVAGSYAATMMSSAAVASGGGVAAGSAVAVLQSIGAGGAAAAASGAIGAGSGAVGAGAAALSAVAAGRSNSLVADTVNIRYRKRQGSDLETNDVGTQTD